MKIILVILILLLPKILPSQNVKRVKQAYTLQLKLQATRESTTKGQWDKRETAVVTAE
jgi:hypothetical protein